MSSYTELMEHIQSLKIIDTHEHLPLEEDRPATNDVLAEWLIHYFSCDLISAGLSDEGLALARNTKVDLAKRWAVIEPYWHAAESTGYGRSLVLAARDIYEIDEISSAKIVELNKRFTDAREKGGHYKRVLRDLSRIAVSIKDEKPDPVPDEHEHFVFAMRADPYVMPTHYRDMRARGKSVDLEVHTLDDWMNVTRRQIERHIDGKNRVICLKCGLAYQRSLQFDKVTREAAEEGFNEFFNERNLPDWRGPIKPSTAFQDWMMHHICGIADDNRIVMQIHTGIQEGNGNFIHHSNPTLLSNLLMEYRNCRFDLFHMGYPYMMELGSLAKNFRNVFIDMCWGHIISPEAARRALVEWLDAVPANKISAFGGDYCFVDGVYGHQLLARQNVATALARKVTEGSISLNRAKEMAEWMFIDNPKRLFCLDRFLD